MKYTCPHGHLCDILLQSKLSTSVIYSAVVSLSIDIPPPEDLDSSYCSEATLFPLPPPPEELLITTKRAPPLPPKPAVSKELKSNVQKVTKPQPRSKAFTPDPVYAQVRTGSLRIVCLTVKTFNCDTTPKACLIVFLYS